MTFAEKLFEILAEQLNISDVADAQVAVDRIIEEVENLVLEALNS